MKDEEGETRVGKEGSTLDLPACLFFGALGTNMANIRRKLNQIKLPCFGVDIVLSVLTIAACFTREPLHDPGMGRENGEAMV